MRAREIAETLVNGNITAARDAMIDLGSGYGVDAGTALDVVEELVELYVDINNGYAPEEQWAAALNKVRRCLNGGT